MTIQTIATTGDDLALREALVSADLPIDDIAEPGRSFFRVEQDGTLLGFCGFELYGDDALIRSIVVPAPQRGKGAGRAVTEALLGRVRASGGRQAYLLTTTATHFFEHLGFAMISRAKAPDSILGTRQATTICTSADLLTKAL